ncbi:MAG: hypothetical protein HC819_01495 [Cyclobacteriaceae bacterium]|nr:hypothetical protein [Cyclobacteriaceae bacterium]
MKFTNKTKEQFLSEAIDQGIPESIASKVAEQCFIDQEEQFGTFKNCQSKMAVTNMIHEKWQDIPQIEKDKLYHQITKDLQIQNLRI